MCFCVCVRANKQAEIDLTPSLQSCLCGSACVSHNQSAGGEVAQLLWLRREGCIAPVTPPAGKQVRFKWWSTRNQSVKTQRALANNPWFNLSSSSNLTEHTKKRKKKKVVMGQIRLSPSQKLCKLMGDDLELPKSLDIFLKGLPGRRRRESDLGPQPVWLYAVCWQ